jgi:uncharacterized protein with PIN domain
MPCIEDYKMHMEKWNMVVVTAANGLHRRYVYELALLLRNKSLNHQVLQLIKLQMEEMYLLLGTA